MRNYRPVHRADRVRTAGAAALGLAGAVLTAAALVTGTAGAAGADQPDPQVCADLDSGKINTSGEPQTVTVTAPDGFLIDGYCVKSGSVQGENGPQYFDVDPPVAELTFDYPGGKAISHYSVSYVPIVTETPTETPTETVTETPTETPTETVTETPTETPTETVTDTPTETVTETPTETTTPTETETPVETPTESVTVLPTETTDPTDDVTVKGEETETPTALPTAVDAGAQGAATSDGLRLMGVALGLVLLAAAAALAFTGRQRGAHQL